MAVDSQRDAPIPVHDAKQKAYLGRPGQRLLACKKAQTSLSL